MVSLGGEGAFPPGSLVQFNTVLGSTVEGQVVCFDPTLKVLAIKDTSGAGGKPMLRVFNLTVIADIKEMDGTVASDTIENLIANCNISSQQVADRCSKAESRRLVELMEEDVPLEGQKAFVQLRRTLDDVCWKGADISVLGRVIVKAPYNPESAQTLQDNDQSVAALAQVKKILSKPFVPERRLVAVSNKFDE